jgi:PTH1 family peptidyl-tRNA hydrolase
MAAIFRFFVFRRLTMLLIAGLGNPGRKYHQTRHNIGFMFLDYLAEKGGVTLKESKWEADLVKTSLWSDPLLLVKPTPYMNLSGRSVSRIASYYQIPPARIVVIHDDLDLDVGRLKIVFARGAGGHNGIKSIIEHLGTREFTRIRVGIGRPPAHVPPAAFVLSPFNQAELDLIGPAFSCIEQGLKIIENDGVSAAMNFVNCGGK